METRARWRKGEDGVRESVAGLVDALRDGMGAVAVALFDDDRAEPTDDPGPRPLSFWSAFADLGCVDLDWQAPYATLRREGRFETTCSCRAGHRICAFLIHGRWVLITIAHRQPVPEETAAIVSGLSALADRLPPRKPPQSGGTDWYDDEPERAKARGQGTPIWWIRSPSR